MGPDDSKSRILPLSADAISQLHSAKHVISLQGVIFALLENSLDAGANKVEIIVDFSRVGCEVEDNGCGILSPEFQEHGSLAKMYRTSKPGRSADEESHGSAGTFLASLAALSWLKITSRHRDDEGHASMILHRGKVLARQTNVMSLDACGQGTKVVVRDLFGNIPVRRKQRISREDPKELDEKAWAALTHGIVARLLAWPKPCSVKVREALSSSARSMKVSAHHSSVSAALTEKSLNQLSGSKTQFDVRDALSITYHAGLARSESRQHWVPVSATASDMSVKGAICLDPSPTKSCQFISIGIRPCATLDGHHELYNAVNTVFAHSSFGTMEDLRDLDEAEKDRRKRDRRYKNDGYTRKQLLGRKGVDRWPMFVLQIKFRNREDHGAIIEGMSDASLDAIVDMLEATVTQWLAAHHFRPQKRRGRRNKSQTGPVMASSPPAQRASGERPAQQKSATPIDTTPVLKRASDVECAATSKRRRVLDVFGRGVDLHRPPTLSEQGPYTSLDAWSRIKSGRAVSREGIIQTEKLSAGPNSAAVQSAGAPNKAALTFPALDVGSLGSAKRKDVAQLGETVLFDTIDRGVVPSVNVDRGSSDDFGNVDESAMIAAAGETATEVSQSRSDYDGAEGLVIPDNWLTWMDPDTKQVCKVSARTGIVLPVLAKAFPQAPRTSHTDMIPIGQSVTLDRSLSSAGRPLSLSKRTATPSERPPSNWFLGFLKDWNNPVFNHQDEARIPVASFDGLGPNIPVSDSKRCTSQGLTQHFAEAATKGNKRLSKHALRNAKVVAQVDDKFILCKFPSTKEAGDGHEALVLVDQHAASERVILERLFQELCTPAANHNAEAGPVEEGPVHHVERNGGGCSSAIRTVDLEKPLHFQVSNIEHNLFAKHVQHFADWGIMYELSTCQGAMTASQVRPPSPERKLIVRALPHGIAERCTLFPNLLVDLLRSEIWTTSETGSRPRTALQPRQASSLDRRDIHEHGWLADIGSCPKGMLEMLSSRACRSAIMFNDKLSHEECEELVADLSRCAFPFTCAHGRVSMVPLVEVGGGADEGGFGILGSEKETPDEATFPAAFRQWMGS